MDIQQYVAQLLGQFAAYLPLGYGFGAGMVSAVNPCGFAMLPVYLSLYLGLEDVAAQRRPVLYRFLRAIYVTVVVTCGFGLLFAFVGGVVSAGGAFLQAVVPWFSLIIGVLLLFLGIILLLGKHISLPFMLQLGAKIGDPRHLTLKGFFLFGLAFGATSLGCTLPIFLAVVGSSLAAGDFINGLKEFASYTLGMGFVLLVLTLGMTFVKQGVVVGMLRRFQPFVQKISALLLLLAGCYIIYDRLKSGLFL